MDLQLLFKQYLHHKQFINSSHFEKEMVVTCDNPPSVWGEFT